MRWNSNPQPHPTSIDIRAGGLDFFFHPLASCAIVTRHHELRSDDDDRKTKKIFFLVGWLGEFTSRARREYHTQIFLLAAMIELYI